MLWESMVQRVTFTLNYLTDCLYLCYSTLMSPHCRSISLALLYYFGKSISANLFKPKYNCIFYLVTGYYGGWGGLLL